MDFLPGAMNAVGGLVVLKVAHDIGTSIGKTPKRYASKKRVLRKAIPRKTKGSVFRGY